MLGHYIFYLWHVVANTYVQIGAVFAKLNEIDLENYKENSFSFLGLSILLLWISTKYHYFIPLEILIYISASIFRSIAYFYSILCSGESFKLLDSCFSYTYVLLVHLDTLNWHDVEQWQSTLIIFAGIILVLRFICWLSQESSDESVRLLLIIFSLACGSFLLITFCSDYLKEYVDPSKI